MKAIPVIEPQEAKGFLDVHKRLHSNLQDAKITNLEYAVHQFVVNNIVSHPDQREVTQFLFDNTEALIQILSDINAARAAKG